ncbi:UNVERIFIED_CONTAM: hypothetical protein H355_003076 [Colinus virginianus]|nr:hypothetical protein H355_003076 [Colinus virginianus]
MAAVRTFLRWRRRLGSAPIAPPARRLWAGGGAGPRKWRRELGWAAGAALAGYAGYQLSERRREPSRPPAAAEAGGTRALLPIPVAAAAKETVDVLVITDSIMMTLAEWVILLATENRSDVEDLHLYATPREQRFRRFASLEFEGQLYMTPYDFIQAVTNDEPTRAKKWRSLSKQELNQILMETPPVWKGSSKLFRNLNERVDIITEPLSHNTQCSQPELSVYSYHIPVQTKGENAFKCHLLHRIFIPLMYFNKNVFCFFTEPHAGFRIAFNMFDTDGNEMVDKKEFLVLQEIFRKKNEKRERKGDEEKRALLRLQLYGYHTPTNSVLKTEGEDLVPRSYWDTLRRSTSQALFSDLAEGITFDEFRSFFQFLNNLEDFTIAMQMYNFASRSIGQDEFKRAVYVATGVKLSPHLVNTVFKIFDVDRDDQLSYKEFIGIMKDRLNRGFRGYKPIQRYTTFKSCVRKELYSR